MRSEAVREVAKAIEDLPDGQREALILRALDGLSVPATADYLKISEDAVKNRLLTARKKLRDKLAPEVLAELDIVCDAGERDTATPLGDSGEPD